MNLKNTLFILAIVIFLLQIIFLNKETNDNFSESKSSQHKVVALSTFPLYDIAKNIAKNKITTYMILPIGVDIHHFEPTPKDIVKLNNSSLVIYSGASLEPWIDALNFKTKRLDMSKYVDLIKLGNTHTSHEHEHHNVDPHYWLSISNMKKATIKITQEMIKLDSANKDFFIQNQKEYMKKLDALDALYKKQLNNCENKEILTNHNAFSYLAKSYNFKTLSLSSISPDASVNAKSMINLINHIKEHNISTVFYEDFASSRAIDTVAKESNIEVEVLQPLANITLDQKEQNLSYEDIMKQNLSKIAKAMECK